MAKPPLTPDPETPSSAAWRIPYLSMKRVKFDLIRAEQELAGARQCIVCLCGAVLTASAMAFLYKFGAMPPWGLAATGTLLCLFLATGLLYAWLPALREQWHEQQICQAWHHAQRRERHMGAGKRTAERRPLTLTPKLTGPTAGTHEADAAAPRPVAARETADRAG